MIIQPGQQASATMQPSDHKNQQLKHIQPFCTHTTVLFVTFSTVFAELHELFNRLGLVLDYFAQVIG